MGEPWPAGHPGVLVLPGGRRVRGRALRRPLPPGPPPEYALQLLGRRPRAAPWPARWVRWPDFGLPTDRADAWDAFRDAWGRAATERVEITCGGGVGRTGTALACLAVVAGVPPAEAVGHVRTRYHPRAAETPWQRRFLALGPP